MVHIGQTVYCVPSCMQLMKTKDGMYEQPKPLKARVIFVHYSHDFYVVRFEESGLREAYRFD